MACTEFIIRLVTILCSRKLEGTSNNRKKPMIEGFLSQGTDI